MLDLCFRLLCYCSYVKRLWCMRVYAYGSFHCIVQCNWACLTCKSAIEIKSLSSSSTTANVWDISFHFTTEWLHELQLVHNPITLSKGSFTLVSKSSVQLNQMYQVWKKYLFTTCNRSLSWTYSITNTKIEFSPLNPMRACTHTKTFSMSLKRPTRHVSIPVIQTVIEVYKKMRAEQSIFSYDLNRR